MSKRAIIVGSNGIETSVANRDLVQVMIDKLGWNVDRERVNTKSFEFYAVDDMEISINGYPRFTLNAGDAIEESEKYINSFVLITDGAKYRYYAKF